MSDSMRQAISENAIIAALDNNEPQLCVQLPGHIAPLGSSLIRSADCIDDHMVPESELLAGQSPDDKVCGVMRRSGRADSRSPHGGFGLVHSEHGTAERSPKVGRQRALPASRKTRDDNQHSRDFATTLRRSVHTPDSNGASGNEGR